MQVLVLDDIDSVFITSMHDAGFVVTLNPKITLEELLFTIAEYEVLIVNSTTIVDKVLIDKGVKLKAIGRPGSGMENIDLSYASKKGILCYNSPEGNADAVAEHVIGMLLMFNRNILIAQREVKIGAWKRKENTGIELGGKVLGIIGYGNTGSSLAKKLSGFDMNLLAYDKYKTDFSNHYVQECSLSMLFEQADIVSVHLPLTSETNCFANATFFNSFKKPILFINSSRGSVVVLEDLKTAIETNKVSGALLDVLEKEPIEALLSAKNNLAEWFLKSPQVVITPHIAGWTKEAKYKMAKILAERLKNNLKIN
jgi:D-3-phosphoglycerate dehydrogenase